MGGGVRIFSFISSYRTENGGVVNCPMDINLNITVCYIVLTTLQGDDDCILVSVLKP